MFKLFVGGISPETTENDLQEYFGSFGRLSGHKIVFDKHSGVSKGYGFIICESRRTHDRILENKKHLVRGRIVDVNRALERNGSVPEDILNKGFRKLFVGGLPSCAGDGHLSEHFSRFGRVLNAYVIYDPHTKESKNFGYVEFDSVQVALDVLRNYSHSLFGKKITLEPHKHGLRALASTTSIQLGCEQPQQPGGPASDKHRKTESTVCASPQPAAAAGAARQSGLLAAPSKTPQTGPALQQPPSCAEVLSKAGFDGEPASIAYKLTNNTLQDIDTFDKSPDDSDSDSNDARSTFYRHLKRLKQQNSDFDLLLRDEADHLYKFSFESRSSKALRLSRLSAFVGRCPAS
jgi:RNA recognition motif-containing protein